MTNEAKPQDGSTVQGYRTLGEKEISDMNELKALSRQFIEKLSALKVIAATSPSVTADDATNRWLARARTAMQDACMFGCRAIARPDDDC